MGAAPTDTLGFGRLVPGPGWVVLDAARDQQFTGELVLIADDAVRVYLERGRIYLAERATDPTLAERLVECGALTQEQLDYGRLDIAGFDHLGRLFDRVPTASRDAVMVATELMNDQVVSWLAGQQVQSVGATPYRHHGSGIHRWSDPAAPRQPYSPWPAPAVTLSDPHPTHPIDTAAVELAEAPADPPPADEPPSAAPEVTAQNPPDDAPVDHRESARPPVDAPPDVPAATPPAATPDDPDSPTPIPDASTEPLPRRNDTPEPADAAPIDDEDLPPLPTRQVRNRPSASSPVPATPGATEPSPSPAAEPASADDVVVTWDSPGPTGLPTTGAARSRPLIPTALDGTENSTPSSDESFGVIWPTGEVAPLAGNTDHGSDAGSASAADDGDADADDDGTTDEDTDDGSPEEASQDAVAVTTTPDASQANEALAVRRAVATIDTGSLAARRRLVASTQTPAPEAPPADEPINPTLPVRATMASVEPGEEDAKGTDGRPTALRRVLDNLRRD